MASSSMRCAWMKKLSLADYCKDKRFAQRLDANGHLSTRGRFALISRHFFYFGRKAVPIPSRFLCYPLEKKGQGFRYKNFSEDFISDFTTWLETNFKVGRKGSPCKPLPELGTKMCTPARTKVMRRLCG